MPLFVINRAQRRDLRTHIIANTPESREFPPHFFSFPRFSFLSAERKEKLYESGTLAKLSYHGNIQHRLFHRADKAYKRPVWAINSGMAGGRPRGPPEEVLPTAQISGGRKSPYLGTETIRRAARYQMTLNGDGEAHR